MNARSVWLLSLLAACDGGGAMDAGIDGRRGTDAATVRCADAGDCAGEAYAGLCAGGACVECVSDGDCGDEALGPSCDQARGYCVCEDDDGCAGNVHGPLCHPVAGACGCERDRDCGDDSTCAIEPYLGAGVRTCQPP